MQLSLRSLGYTLCMFFLFSLAVHAAPAPPELTGTAAISVDMDTDEIIYTKNIDAKVYPASITKLMTALLLAENKQPADALVYTQTAKAQPPYSYNHNIHPVAVGDTISAEDAMDILLLFSGNDIAYLIADNVSGDAGKFAAAMNDKARQLKMSGTHWVTPNGLDAGKNGHYATAYDLALLGMAAYRNPWIQQSMAKKTSLVHSAHGLVGTVENSNKLLGKDGCVGGKTGYTAKAGRCFVAMYERAGRHIIGVVMNSTYNFPQDTIVFADMEKLINWSYAAPKAALYPSGATIQTATVEYNVLPYFGPKKLAKIPLIVKQDVNYYANDVTPVTTVKLGVIDPWKLDKNSVIGTLELAQRDASSSNNLYPLIATGDIIKDNMAIYLWATLGLMLMVVGIVVVIVYVRRRMGEG